MQRDRKGEENPGLYLQPAAGGPLEVIQHDQGVQVHFEAVSSDSKLVYFTANDRKADSYVVYRWDVAKKTKDVAFDQEEGLWHVSDVKDDGRLLLRKETGSLTAEYSEYDPAKKALTPLLGQGEKEEYEARYGAREGSLVVLTNKLGDFRRLYSLSGGPGGKLEPLGDDVKADVDTFDVDRKRRRILYTTNEGGFGRPHALDARTLKPIKLPALPEADRVTFGATTPDARYTTVGIDDGRHPMQGYVIDWTRRPHRRSGTRPAPRDRHHVLRAGADGRRLPGARRHEDPGSRAQAEVHRQHSLSRRRLVPRGGPRGRHGRGSSVGAQMFVDRQASSTSRPTCAPARRSDGFGKAWLHADDGPKRLEIITDIEDAGKWARSHFAAGGRDAQGRHLRSGSYGGYSVLMPGWRCSRAPTTPASTWSASAT